MENSKLRGMLFGSFIGDAMALGPHWIYDLDKLERKFGDMVGITSPPIDSYHLGKTKGDFTHYGDQAYLLLDYLSSVNEFDIMEFKNIWLEFMKNYRGYKDHATKESIDFLSHGGKTGSSSEELGGIARMAPLIYKYSRNNENIKKYLEEETSLTHNNKIVIDVGLFLEKLVFSILAGEEIEKAIGIAKKYSPDYIIKMVEMAENKISKTSKEAIVEFGQSCGSTHAFPASIYFILKYKKDIFNGLKENCLSGGDSAARGMIIGMVLGAYLGEEGLPPKMVLDINKYNEIVEKL